ncbi:lysozyme inhibitor LprI family protein [Rhizobium sp. CNPSo 4062]|uniref:lysozyme inhibitor LprI family protein n=1 Tax=Rhizobium sp. CNPSo 4062 TaxID=3021410 RepID=UPI00254E85AD|nr:lysozyme inhibitor LprI family protein [Rhizobium sp. CNPSo 4062]MDK4702884.1 lysozyme inhibitor LprI family protein [Rhizobium sp. CNPSo 4062]
MSMKLLASAAALVAVLVCGPVFAQKTVSRSGGDCANAQTQTDMNVCAVLEFGEADKALNAQYKKTRAAMVAIDADLDNDMKGAEKALIKAQRAWVDYRDGECETQGFQARGGSMEPMLVSGCKADLTKKRTKELKDLADGPEGNQ